MIFVSIIQCKHFICSLLEINAQLQNNCILQGERIIGNWSPIYRNGTQPSALPGYWTASVGPSLSANSRRHLYLLFTLPLGVLSYGTVVRSWGVRLSDRPPPSAIVPVTSPLGVPMTQAGAGAGGWWRAVACHLRRRSLVPPLQTRKSVVSGNHRVRGVILDAPLCRNNPPKEPFRYTLHGISQPPFTPFTKPKPSVYGTR